MGVRVGVRDELCVAESEAAGDNDRVNDGEIEGVPVCDDEALSLRELLWLDVAVDEVVDESDGDSD